MKMDGIEDPAYHEGRLSRKEGREIAYRCMNHCFKTVSHDFDAIWEM